jgi:hypothetical protein
LASEKQKRREEIMAQILESNNYGMFEILSFNRDVTKTKKLEASMREHGFLDAHPLDVQRIGNGKLKIKAGHHRFFVARRLGIFVKYVIDNHTATIHELEGTVVPWSMQHFLTSHYRDGKPEYRKVMDYCDETGISVAPAVAMLGGHSAGTANFIDDFKDGTYKVNEGCGHAEIVKGIVLYLKKNGVKFYNNSLLVQAISKIAWVREFDAAQMTSKIKSFHGMMEKKANLDQYLDSLEELYNRQSRSKLPLKFLAIEEAKRRNVVGLGKK